MGRIRCKIYFKQEYSYMNGCFIITIAISKGISRQFMANNLLHHGRRACESHHFVDFAYQTLSLVRRTFVFLGSSEFPDPSPSAFTLTKQEKSKGGRYSCFETPFDEGKSAFCSTLYITKQRKFVPLFFFLFESHSRFLY